MEVVQRRDRLWGLAVVSTLTFVAMAMAVSRRVTDGFDVAVAHAIHALRTPVLDPIMDGVGHAGEWRGIFIAIALTSAWAIYRNRLRLAPVLVGLGLAAQGINHLLKIVIERQRPELLASAVPDSFAFPSGHAMSAMAVYPAIAAVVIALRPGLRTLVIATTAVLVLVIGFTRVYRGVHWPMDVLGGFAAGVPLLVIALRLFGNR